MKEQDIINAIKRVEERVKLEGTMISILLVIIIVILLIK